MFCTGCGAGQPDGSAFCTSCGARLDDPSNMPREPATPTAKAPSPPRAGAFLPPPPERVPPPAAAGPPSGLPPMQPGAPAAGGSASGFVSKLFDFGLTGFATTANARIVFALVIAFSGLSAFLCLYLATIAPDIGPVFLVALAPLVFVVPVAVARSVLEVLLLKDATPTSRVDPHL